MFTQTLNLDKSAYPNVKKSKKKKSCDFCAENGVERAYTWIKVQYIKRDAIS